MLPEGLGPPEGSVLEPYGQRLGGEVGQHHGEDGGLSGTAARPQHQLLIWREVTPLKRANYACRILTRASKAAN